MPSRSAHETEEAVTINLPNTLALKVGGKFKLTATTLARAEAALRDMPNVSEHWVATELQALCLAHRALQNPNFTQQEVVRLSVPSAALKSQATSFDYPIVARIASSLCILLQRKFTRTPKSLQLVEAHVEAIKACVRDNIRSLDHPVGAALASALDREVALL